MKKLSVLMASLMCLTVGGVYAAWTYSESAISQQTADKGVQLQGYTDTKDAPGVYTLTPQVNSSNPVDSENLFYFDSNLQVNNKTDDPHKVCFVTNCSLVITFTADEHAPNDLRTNGLDTTVSFMLSKNIEEFTFVGKRVFTQAKLTSLQISGVGTDTDPSDGAANWTKTGENVFTCTISQDHLVALLGLTVNQDLRLENSAEHKAFDEAITGLTIKTTVAKKA